MKFAPCTYGRALIFKATTSHTGPLTFLGFPGSSRRSSRACRADRGPRDGYIKAAHVGVSDARSINDHGGSSSRATVREFQEILMLPSTGSARTPTPGSRSRICGRHDSSDPAEYRNSRKRTRTRSRSIRPRMVQTRPAIGGKKNRKRKGQV